MHFSRDFIFLCLTLKAIFFFAIDYFRNKNEMFQLAKNFISLFVVLFMLVSFIQDAKIECKSVSSSLSDIKLKFAPKEMLNLLEKIKLMESLKQAEEKLKMRILLELNRKKIYQDTLGARIKGSSVLKDFYTGRY